MAEAGTIEVVAQAIIGSPWLVRNVLPTPCIPILEVFYSEQRTDTLAVAREVVALGPKQSQWSAADDERAVQEINMPLGHRPEHYLAFMWVKFSPAESGT